MGEFEVQVRVTPRAGLLDPEGAAVEGALRSLDFAGVTGVRVGRLIRFRLEAGSPEDARTRVDEMCRKLLANPVTEDYAIEVENLSLSGSGSVVGGGSGRGGPRVAVVTFPGSNCDYDCYKAAQSVMQADAEFVWHAGRELGDADVVMLPGGFSYGDYLRAGAIARFSPIMDAVVRFAEAGGPVLGVCNGFQILCEAGLLPGALIRNRTLRFRSMPVRVRVENADTVFTSAYEEGQVLTLPIAHGQGNYEADEATLDRLESGRRVVFRYVDENGEATDAANPNGSARNIAGIINETGNVLGLMPHPERAVEGQLGSTDGAGLFRSLRSYVTAPGDNRKGAKDAKEFAKEGI